MKTNESELIDAQEEDKYDWDIEFDPEKLVVEAEGYHRVVTVITMYKSIKASSADDWIDVEVNGYNVHLDIKENTTGKERKGTINIYASDDGKNILKTATYEVTQLPYPDEGDGLAFMNFSKLRIDTIIGTGGKSGRRVLRCGDRRTGRGRLSLLRQAYRHGAMGQRHLRKRRAWAQHRHGLRAVCRKHQQ